MSLALILGFTWFFWLDIGHNHAIMSTYRARNVSHMNMEQIVQDFTVDLELMISEYVSKGMNPAQIKLIMQHAAAEIWQNLSP